MRIADGDKLQRRLVAQDVVDDRLDQPGLRRRRGAVHQHRQRRAGDEHAVRGRVAQQPEECVHQGDVRVDGRYPRRMRLVPLPARAVHDAARDRAISAAASPARAAAIARRVQRRRIARPPRRRRPPHRLPHDAADRVDHLLDRMRPPGAGVVGTGSRAALERRQRAHVRVRQIAHVNVVAQTGAVGRRIVLAEHLQGPRRRSPPRSRAESGGSPGS